MVSGMVDAVSFLGLGHVFTANMTGNVVVLGFAAAGAKGFSVPASLTSVCSFLLGAAVAGRICLHVGSRRLWLVFAMLAEAGLTGAAALASALASGHVGTGWARYTVIALLAFAMGVRNSTIRRLAIPESTNVLTMTFAGGHDPRAGRRAAAVLAMLGGAIVGAALFLHRGATLTLVVIAVAVAAAAVWFAMSRA
jgi:uncharacterized membrane protein YoaK (UPF0700 family)